MTGINLHHHNPWYSDDVAPFTIAQDADWGVLYFNPCTKRLEQKNEIIKYFSDIDANKVEFKIAMSIIHPSNSIKELLGNKIIHKFVNLVI
jgi:hypothetical protein